jgi:hypothetical protein
MGWFPFSLTSTSHNPPGHTPGLSDISHHMPGTNKGEEWVLNGRREAGRDDPNAVRTARDSTSVNPADREPIDSRMPYLPPA